MKICCIGDSHLGHIKPAWEKLKSRYPDVSVGFKVERTYGTQSLSIKGRDAASNGSTLSDILLSYDPVIDCSEWDAFVVFGMHYSIARLAQSYRKFRREDQVEESSTYFLSAGAYWALVEGMFRATKAARVIDALQNSTDKPILYSQQANPLEWVKGRAEPGLDHLGLIEESGDDSSLADVYDQALGILQAGGVQVLRQPIKTRSGNIFTKSEYGLADPSDDSAESPYSRGDYYHMNQTYGVLVLHDLLDHALPLIG